MKYCLSILFFATFLNAKSQTIEKFFDYEWKPCIANEARFYSVISKTDSGYNRNDYFIRERSLLMSGKYSDKECKIPNGYFHYYHSNKMLESEGKYVDGKKNGLWLTYHNNGMMRDSTVYDFDQLTGTSLSWHSNGYLSDSIVVNEDGSAVQIAWFENGSISLAGLYSRGKQNGKWKFYHNNGAISSIEIFNEGNLVGKTYYSEDGAVQSDTTNKNREAIFPGKSSSAWDNYIHKNIYFPDQYKIVNADKAVVIISFAINEEGKVVDVFVSTPFSPEFDRIAVNAISRSPKWKPAIRHNRKVKSWITQKVTFIQE